MVPSTQKKGNKIYTDILKNTNKIKKQSVEQERENCTQIYLDQKIQTRQRNTTHTQVLSIEVPTLKEY